MPISIKVTYKKHVWAARVSSYIMSFPTRWKILERLGNCVQRCDYDSASKTRKLKQFAALSHFLNCSCKTFYRIFQCFLIHNIARNTGCEFAFYMCNSFCEMGILETLVFLNTCLHKKKMQQTLHPSMPRLSTGPHPNICCRAKR